MLSNTMSREVAARLDDPATMLIDRWIYQVAAECSQPFERSHIVQPDQAAVANHVGIDDGDQPALGWRGGPIRCALRGHGRPRLTTLAQIVTPQPNNVIAKGFETLDRRPAPR